MQDLEYVNEDKSLTPKGIAPREIGTTNCVLRTELLSSDVLISLSESEVIEFLSGFASNKNEIFIENIPYINKTFVNQTKKFKDVYKNKKKKKKVMILRKINIIEE